MLLDIEGVEALRNVIEDAMRRVTAAPHFGTLRIEAEFFEDGA